MSLAKLASKMGSKTNQPCVSPSGPSSGCMLSFLKSSSGWSHCRSLGLVVWFRAGGLSSELKSRFSFYSQWQWD